MTNQRRFIDNLAAAALISTASRSSTATPRSISR
jgi:hypothetical protein